MQGGPDRSADCIAQSVLIDFADSKPDLTWNTIELVIENYAEFDFYAETATEAQWVCGVLAAGPVEDLLSYHGGRFIDRFEEKARVDKRWAWVLGGAWQFQMTEPIWRRVQLAADYAYWERGSVLKKMPAISDTQA